MLVQIVVASLYFAVESHLCLSECIEATKRERNRNLENDRYRKHGMKSSKQLRARARALRYARR
jgi:hypothetical protein